MNNKTLWIVFIALLLIYGASKLFTGNKNSSFDAQLVKIDTAQITTILMYPKAEGQQEIRLDKQANGWIATMNNNSVNATPQSMTGILNHLASIKTTRMVAKTSGKWADYEVDEGNGSKIKVMNGDKLMDEFVVGRFMFNQEKRTATTFLRLAKNEEVYAVDGFLSMAMNKKFDSFRDKSFLNLKNAEIVELDYSDHQNASSVLLRKSSIGTWLNANQEVQDSASIATFINGLNKVDGSNFAPAISALSKDELLLHSLKLKANNMADEIVISCFKNEEDPEQLVVHSSQYPDSYFLSDSDELFKKVFGYYTNQTMKYSK